MPDSEFSLPDTYGLRRTSWAARQQVWIGTVNVSEAVQSGQLSSALGDMSRANITLNRASALIAHIDFSAQVIVGTGHTESQRSFTGYVLAAQWHDDGNSLHLECVSHPEMLERATGRISATGAHLDLVFALAREAGLSDDRIRIEGSDQLSNELFEVVTPIDGLIISEPIRLGSVTFTADTSMSLLANNSRSAALIDRWHAASAYALTYSQARRMLDAETTGRRKISDAVAWINVSRRFANLQWPDGTTRAWSRQQFRETASVVGVTQVRGLTSMRIWMREPGSARNYDVRGVDFSALGAHALSGARKGLREALVSAARAMTSDDPHVRITAISECLEFYAGSIRTTSRISKTHRKALRRLAADWPDDEKTAVTQLLDASGTAPLLTRVRLQLTADGVPIADEELDALASVRKMRNDLVHGKAISASAQLDEAIALLARILVFAIYADSRQRVVTTGPFDPFLAN